MELPFRMRLEERQRNITSLLCVGLDIDIRAENFPLAAKKESDYATLLEFARPIIDVTHPYACAYKLNLAFWEKSGPPGLVALSDTIGYIREVAPHVLVICDGKRTDIGTTNIQYVEALFGYLGADAVTVNPYFGGESLKPFLDQHNKGIFVLCRTSNPGSGEMQDAKIVLEPDMRTEMEMFSGNKISKNYIRMYQHVAYRVAAHWNKDRNCALVMGATYPEELGLVRNIVGDIPILIPGIGTQGGDLEKAVQLGKDSRGMGIVINVSSGITGAAFPFEPNGLLDFEKAGTVAKSFRDRINGYR